MVNNSWLVVSNMNGWFSIHMLGMSSETHRRTPCFFQDGYCTTNQLCISVLQMRLFHHFHPFPMPVWHSMTVTQSHWPMSLYHHFILVYKPFPMHSSWFISPALWCFLPIFVQIVLLIINQIWSALSFFKLTTINYFVVLICDRKHFLYHLEWRNYSSQVSLNDARERRYRFDRIFPGQTTNREVSWAY